MKLFRYLFLIILVATLTVVGFGQKSDAEFAAEIDGLFSRYNAATPGVAVAVVKDGKTIFQKGYGTANLEYGVAVTPKTVFQIASVSKQFTAFAVYLLEKQGRITLEDDVRKYVPELPEYGKTVKIKHLLAHTSGIKDQGSVLSLAGWGVGDAATTEQYLRVVSRQKELNFDPGTGFLYSNTGYTLAAEIVARVSGMTFAEYSKKYIFEPLGMTDTQFYDDYERLVKYRADSYELSGGVYKKVPLTNSSPGASNLYTTVEDMTKWVLNFDNPKAGDAEMIRRFGEGSMLNNGEPVVYAVSDGQSIVHAKGQNTWTYRGVRLMSFGGHAAGFRSFLGRFPDKRLAVIALSNDEHYLNFDDSIRIAALYLKNDLKPETVATNPQTQRRPAEMPKNDPKDFEGRYYSEELETFYNASVRNGKLVLTQIRHGAIELTETGADKYSGRIVYPVEIEFERDEKRNVIGFKISNFGAKNVRFKREILR